MKTILFCGANPLGQRKLRTDHEVDHIRKEIRLAGKGDALRIEHRLALTLTDLQSALLEVKPDWLHLSCHGEAGDLMFLDDAQQLKKIPGRALARQLKTTPGNLQGCLLMACESEPTAKEIAAHLPFAVGWIDPVSDTAALAYTRSFYVALAQDQTPEVCHENGCVAVDTLGLVQEEPVLHRQQSAGCTLNMNAAPPPDFSALGVPKALIEVDSPVDRWQTLEAPGSANWRRARAGLDAALKQIRGHRGPIEVFASTAYSIGIDLALKLAEQNADAHYWQFHGPRDQGRWVRWGRAQDRGQQPVLRLQSPVTALDPGRPVVLKVNITAEIITEEAAAGLVRARVRDEQELTLAHPTPGFTAISDPQAAQQAASDLMTALTAIRDKVLLETTHLFYVGPLAVLMMAAPRLRTLNPVVIYERGKLGSENQSFRPAPRFEGGRGEWFP